MLDESATQNQLLGRASTISHETSHMWFGDLVTMQWFNDVWMKEVFANFMAAKIVNPSFPDVNHDLRFLLENYPAAYDVDRTDGANPIRQQLANLNEAGTLYGAIIYQKAPIVMRQLELLVGADAFRDGLREYLRRSCVRQRDLDGPDRASSTRGRPADLVSLEPRVGRRARPADDPHRTRGGRRQDRAAVAFTRRTRAGRGLALAGDGCRCWSARPAASKAFDVTLDAADTPTCRTPSACRRRSACCRSGGGLGYGDFDLDRTTLDYAHDVAAHDPRSADARRGARRRWWETMLEGRVRARHGHDRTLLAAAAARDRRARSCSDCSATSRTTFWRYTAPDDRRGAGRPHSSQSSARASTRAKTTRPQGRVVQRAARRRDDARDRRHGSSASGARDDGPGPAARRDRRGGPGAGAGRARRAGRRRRSSRRRSARFKNADRKARFAFVMPAVSGDQAARDKFFDGLEDVENRRHEAWVLDAMGYLNHPLRAAASKKYMRPALDLVREIQRTGDIFFPKRWADAALSGYQSVQTAADVRDVHRPAAGRLSAAAAVGAALGGRPAVPGGEAAEPIGTNRALPDIALAPMPGA